jgi:hypothetical protein
MTGHVSNSDFKELTWVMLSVFYLFYEEDAAVICCSLIDTQQIYYFAMKLKAAGFRMI